MALVHLLTNCQGSSQRSKKRPRDDDDTDDGEYNTTIPTCDRTVTEVGEHPVPASNRASGLFFSERGTSNVADGTHAKTVSKEASEWNIRRIPDLSFILHPSHEGSSPEMERKSDSQWSAHDTEEGAIGKACFTLRLTQKGLKHL